MVTSVNASSSSSFVVVTDLTSNVEYQFEVMAVAELDGDVMMGEISNEYTKRLTPTSIPTTQINIAPIIGGVVVFIVAVAFVAVVVVILVYSGLLLPIATVKWAYTILLSVYRFQGTHCIPINQTST